MTIHVNIGDAKTRLSQLVAAALRGEEVVVDKAGVPAVRLVPVAEESDAVIERRAARRRAAFGMYRHLVGDREIVIRDLKPTEEELEERWRRKFGDPA